MSLGQYLGCDHEPFSVVLPNGRKARGVRYNMSHFIEQCVERYLSLAPAGTKLKKVSTPFIAEVAGVGESRAPVHGVDPVQCTWCAHTFPSKDGRQLFKAEGKPPDAQAASRETAEAGELAGSAAKILMRILYAAR